MGIADGAKQAINTVIESLFGSDFIVKSVSKTFNDYGDETVSVDSSRTVKGAYTNYNPFRKSLQVSGDVSEGVMRLYVKSDDNVQSGDIVEFDGVEYVAKEVSFLGFANVKIVDVFNLVKKL